MKMRCSRVLAAPILRVVYDMLDGVFLAVWVEAAGGVDGKWPASCCTRELIFSRGLVGGGATVTNDKADRLHATDDERGKGDCNWEASRRARKSRSIRL